MRPSNVALSSTCRPRWRHRGACVLAEPASSRPSLAHEGPGFTTLDDWAAYAVSPNGRWRAKPTSAAHQLLDQYLRTNPRGALAEDALALSIEAAAARKDPRAADYARRYLARYPNGRFRKVAERALAR